MRKIKKWISLLLCTVLAMTNAEGLMAAEEGSDQTTTVEEIGSFDGNAESILVVGSDGTQHDGVEYLTVPVVQQFSKAQQENYEWLCDKAAEISAEGKEWTGIDLVVNSDQIPELRIFTPLKKMISTASAAQIVPFKTTVSSEEEIVSVNASFDRVSYFQDQLSADAQEIYSACINAAKKGKNRFSIEGAANQDDFLAAFSVSYSSCPEYYEWLDTVKGDKAYVFYNRDESGDDYSGMKIPKCKYYSKSLEKQAKKKIKSLVKNAKKYANSQSNKNSDYSRDFWIVEYLDNWICKNNYYNNTGASDNKNKMKTADYYYCHSSYGCLLKGYGVCESYARAMSRLLDAAGIPNLFVTGEGADEEGSEGHAWNQVMLDGEWYLEDATWNCETTKNKKKKSTQEYLLIGSADEGELGSDHIPDGQYFLNSPMLSFPAIAANYYGYEWEAEEEEYYQPAA